MGRDAKMKKDRIIHRDKFMQGRMTPQEAHRHFSWKDAKCICGAPACIRVRLFGPVKDLIGDDYAGFMLDLASKNGGSIPLVDFKDGKYVRISDSYACAGCRHILERESAKAPSWMCVEIDRGPTDDKPVVQVGG